MVSVRITAPLVLTLAILGGSLGADAQSRQIGVGGRVLGQASPLAAVGVYAYQLVDRSFHKVITDPQGNFLFQDLPAGLYQIIANKPGFTPVVVMLTRTTAQTYQFLELQLAEQAKPSRSPLSDDFWALRARIPADVLRDIDKPEPDTPDTNGREVRQAAFTAPGPEALLAGFKTEMQAMTGVDRLENLGAGQVSSGRLGIEGRLGEMQVGFSGRFWQMNAEGFDPGKGTTGLAGGAQASAVSLDLKNGNTSRISLVSLNNRLVAHTQNGDAPVDLEHYQVSWSQAVGETSRSDFAAQYTSENNYHRLGAIDPVDIPEASRSWKVEESYTTALSDSSTLQGGFRYRERQFDLSTGGQPGTPFREGSVQAPEQSVDLFSRGALRVQPAVAVEYGLYSTLSDGSLAVTPQAGLLLKLGSGWNLEGSVTRRVYQQAPSLEFLPTLYRDSNLCEQGVESCYELRLSRKLSDDNSIIVNAAERTVGETLRLYFSEDFFDRLESLYLVNGDHLPELRVAFTRRLSPQIISTLESSVAAGGGGIFLAADRTPYQNQVRYTVTSLDTRFQATATNLLVAFHHLAQDLAPVQAAGQLPNELEYDRLRVMLTQDLNVLMNLAGQWMVQLNMDVSRTSSPLASVDTHPHRTFQGGIAVKF